MNSSPISRIRIVKVGLGFGETIAIAISWSLNKSILWAMVHGLCGWFYVLYYVIAY